MQNVSIIGGGFAGVEAAWACAQRGVKVQLYEMRPITTTGAHKTDLLAELVCSNSFKSNNPDSPTGQLKSEMEDLGSIVLPTARKFSVPAGEALAVDRDKFSAEITRKIEDHPNIEVIRKYVGPEQVIELVNQGPTIISTGPLTTKSLAEWMLKVTGSKGLYFYDAVSPTVEASSINFDRVFSASRYGKGEGDDYLNCPFTKEEYFAFVHALVMAERALPHGVAAEDETLEKIKYFAGCMPIEAIAENGEMSLAFGNFKPVGLTDPRTGKRPFAALQLRPENREKTLYTLVACQNRLKWGEQKRIFQLVPGLEQADFVRFGVIHRNTYLNSPTVVSADLQLNSVPNCYIAGQITGVEGYLESAAMGIYAGISASCQAKLVRFPLPGRTCAYGCLINHLQDKTEREFAPMNMNWGLFPTPSEVTKDKGVRRRLQLESARDAFSEWKKSLESTLEFVSLEFQSSTL